MTTSLTRPVSCVSNNFSLYRFYFFDLLELVSLNESDSIDCESDYDGSDYRYAGTCALPIHFDESVGHVGDSFGRVSGMGYVVFVLTGIESIGDVVPLVMLVRKGVESKGG